MSLLLHWLCCCPCAFFSCMQRSLGDIQVKVDKRVRQVGLVNYKYN